MKKILLVISAATLLAPSAFSWGWAHRMIGYIAQEHCTPATREVFDRYLDTLTGGDRSVVELLLQFMGVCLSNVRG